MDMVIAETYKQNEIVFRGKVFIDSKGEELTYIIYRDEEFFTAQCLDVNIASFSDTIDKAKVMIKEALELFFEN